ncbi:hypothetical protein F5Y14DRAFT_319085 [Nemania sp. NC0429]|nr:hypothetical protein F5Y14DRAFT_319085 [Nemania sp. NC0429]
MTNPYSNHNRHPRPQTIPPTSISHPRIPDSSSSPSQELYAQSRHRPQPKSRAQTPSSAPGPPAPSPERPSPNPQAAPHQARTSNSNSNSKIKTQTRIPNGPPHTNSNSRAPRSYPHRPGAGADPTSSGRSDQHQHALSTREILRNPRLEQITGVRPGKVNLMGVTELPPEDLRQLAWALAMPDCFPFKRPRGDRGYSSSPSPSSSASFSSSSPSSSSARRGRY